MEGRTSTDEDRNCRAIPQQIMETKFYTHFAQQFIKERGNHGPWICENWKELWTDLFS